MKMKERYVVKNTVHRITLKLRSSGPGVSATIQRVEQRSDHSKDMRIQKNCKSVHAITGFSRCCGKGTWSGVPKNLSKQRQFRFQKLKSNER